MVKREVTQIITPLSRVLVARVTSNETAWTGYEGKIFRIGYYSKQDGLDCVWLVNDAGEYQETVDQAMIETHFEILELSDETDLFGIEREEIGPITEQSTR